MVISKFLAPGYLLFALGIDYKPSDNFTAFISPATLKMTIVNDQALADSGAFGVDPGKKSLSQFGGYLRLFLKQDLMENISFQSKVDIFSNYLDDPVPDVSWETLLTMKVNKYISATLSTHLLWDKDIDIGVDDNDDGVISDEEYEPRIQFKEVLAIGFSYKF